jgi:exopolysaccharide biosynthesis WecB/TagA/CpsF family protein
MMRKNEKIKFLGMQFDNLSKKDALDTIEQYIQQKTPRKIFTPNVSLLIESRKNKFLKDVYDSCDMLTVDGMALYYAMKIIGTPIQESLSASLLFYPLLEMSQQKGYGIYFVGAKQEVVQKAATNLKEEYPGIRIVGCHHGYFEMENPPRELIRDIQEKKPDIMFIGMSSPYKEKFVVSNTKKLHVPVSLGVGGMFDIAAGKANFAPDWIRKICMEWFYRLVQEPRRMWKRYLTTNSVFLWLFFKALIKKRVLCI